jgi:cell division protein ZipA
MDKDLIRIIIFAIGLVVIIGMIAWSYIKHEKHKRDYDDFDDELSEQAHSELGFDEEDYEEGLEEVGEPQNYDESAQQEKPPSYRDAESKRELEADRSTAPTMRKPAIIQFSIVANRAEGFNGMEIFDVLDDVGLEYGNLQIFERLDARRLVDFGVASLVKPGIFPSTNLAAFHCPGLVFFMQTSKIDNPVAVFDDFVRTFQYVAMQLGGEMWDHHRKPLTEQTIAQLRQSLESS